MKILVTGHKGYIGSHLFSELIRLEHDVRGIDLKDGEDILHCLPDENFDFVFHLAACPRVGYSVEKPAYTLKQNVLVTSTLLEWAKDHNVKRVIFSSSSAVMGNGDGVPTSPYGLHKLMNEMECRLFSSLYGLDTVCLRYFNAYSEDQGFGGAYSTAICAWMEMIRQGKPLRMDGDGEQTRDLVHVDDIVLANIFAMQSHKSFSGKTYSVGCGKSVSMNFIKNFINKYHSVEWNNAPARIGDVRHTLADVSEIKKDLGWVPKVSISEGLERCFKELK
jgi:UDP-glucose 4-epimerase